VCIFEFMHATLTDLRRKTTKVVRPVMAGRGKVTITEHGQPCLEIVSVPRVDRKAALAALQAIGPVKFRARK
jgi:prevent-host-death family protein